MDIRRANITDLKALGPLFDAYRQFYGQQSNLDGGLAFLRDRLELEQSIVLMAWVDDRAVGFTQLFPSFSSARLTRTLILNDLFVSGEARGAGVGHALLEAACEFGRSAGATRLSLSTALDNLNAQALYEKAGWTRNTRFCAYGIELA
jgi:GNAT superfamily N-acetyltransferase